MDNCKICEISNILNMNSDKRLSLPCILNIEDIKKKQYLDYQYDVSSVYNTRQLYGQTNYDELLYRDLEPNPCLGYSKKNICETNKENDLYQLLEYIRDNLSRLPIFVIASLINKFQYNCMYILLNTNIITGKTSYIYNNAFSNNFPSKFHVIRNLRRAGKNIIYTCENFYFEFIIFCIASNNPLNSSFIDNTQRECIKLFNIYVYFRPKDKYKGYETKNKKNRIEEKHMSIEEIFNTSEIKNNTEDYNNYLIQPSNIIGELRNTSNKRKRIDEENILCNGEIEMTMTKYPLVEEFNPEYKISAQELDNEDNNRLDDLDIYYIHRDDMHYNFSREDLGNIDNTKTNNTNGTNGTDITDANDDTDDTDDTDGGIFLPEPKLKLINKKRRLLEK